MNPSENPVLPDPILRPSRWLRAGYSQISFEDGSIWWQNVRADEVVDASCCGTEPAAVGALYAQPAARELLERLADTFREFFPLTAEQWEADLRQTVNPVTLLCLWETVADVFDYYTKDKKLPGRAASDYFWLILDYFNGGPGAALRERHLWTLKRARVERVVAEMERYFHPPYPRRRSPGARSPVGQTVHTPDPWAF